MAAILKCVQSRPIAAPYWIWGLHLEVETKQPVLTDRSEASEPGHWRNLAAHAETTRSAVGCNY